MIDHTVIGIDPSLSSTGVATHDGRHLVVKDSKVTGDGRLVLLDYVINHVGVDAMEAAGDTPVLAVVEDLPTNAMGAGLTGKAQGVVRSTLLQLGLDFLTVPPSVLKKFATGNGAAKKPDMIAAWNARGGTQLKDDNMVDAAFLRLFGIEWLQQGAARDLYDPKVKLVEVSTKGGPPGRAAKRVIDRAV